MEGVRCPACGKASVLEMEDPEGRRARERPFVLGGQLASGLCGPLIRRGRLGLANAEPPQHQKERDQSAEDADAGVGADDHISKYRRDAGPATDPGASGPSDHVNTLSGCGCTSRADAQPPDGTSTEVMTWIIPFAARMSAVNR